MQAQEQAQAAAAAPAPADLDLTAEPSSAATGLDLSAPPATSSSPAPVASSPTPVEPLTPQNVGQNDTNNSSASPAPAAEPVSDVAVGDSNSEDLNFGELSPRHQATWVAIRENNALRIEPSDEKELERRRDLIFWTFRAHFPELIQANIGNDQEVKAIIEEEVEQILPQLLINPVDNLLYNRTSNDDSWEDQSEYRLIQQNSNIKGIPSYIEAACDANGGVLKRICQRVLALRRQREAQAAAPASSAGMAQPLDVIEKALIALEASLDEHRRLDGFATLRISPTPSRASTRSNSVSNIAGLMATTIATTIATPRATPRATPKGNNAGPGSFPTNDAGPTDGENQPTEPQSQFVSGGNNAPDVFPMSAYQEGYDQNGPIVPAGTGPIIFPQAPSNDSNNVIATQPSAATPLAIVVPTPQASTPMPTSTPTAAAPFGSSSSPFPPSNASGSPLVTTTFVAAPQPLSPLVHIAANTPPAAAPQQPRGPFLNRRNAALIALGLTAAEVLGTHYLTVGGSQYAVEGSENTDTSNKSVVPQKLKEWNNAGKGAYRKASTWLKQKYSDVKKNVAERFKSAAPAHEPLSPKKVCF
jgi:hypothetical protein